MKFLVALMILSFSCSTFQKKQNKEKEFVHLWFLDLNEKSGKRTDTEQCAPALLNETIMQGSSDGFLNIVDKQGNLIRKLEASFGIESQPLYQDGILYFATNEGYLKSFSYRKADYTWEYKVDFPIEVTPCISSGIIVVLSSDDTLYGLDVTDGKLLWLNKRSFPIGRVVVKGATTPLCINENVYVGFSDGTFEIVNITNGIVKKKINLQSNSKFIDVDASPILIGDSIITSTYDGSLYNLDANTLNINWELKKGSVSSVIQEGSILYYSSIDGYVYAIKLEDASILWSTKIHKGVPTKGVIYEDYIIVGSSEDGIVIIDKNKGKVLKNIKVGSGVTATPLIDGDMLFFISNAKVLHAFGMI